MVSNGFIHVIAPAFVALAIGSNAVCAQTPDEDTSASVTVEEFGPLESIKDAEYRIGGTDRMFLIEDQWEFDRCTTLLPTLPKIDLGNETLLVIMSWKSAPRSLKGVVCDADTLIIKVEQEKSVSIRDDSNRAPKFLAFKIPTWPGPIRFEVNGERQFTILRGDALAARSDELWEEILRIHSGGSPNRPELVRHYKRLWRDATEKEVVEYIMTHKEIYRSFSPMPIYEMLFRDLSDTRATPAIPRILALIDSMGPHDKALEPACKALVGIGGSEVVEQCKQKLDSPRLLTRTTAMGILATLALPSERELAREKLAEIEPGISDNAFMLLERIGISKDDVPAMIHALEQTEAYYRAAPEARPKVLYFGGETAKRIIYAFGEMGPAAKDALPILERFATDTRLPQPGFQPDAKVAIERITVKE